MNQPENEPCEHCGETHPESVGCAEALGVELDEILLDDALKARAKRFATLNEKGAIWNEEGRYYALAADGEETFYDEDGEEM